MMVMARQLPIQIHNIIGDHRCQIDNIGMSNAEIMIFEDYVLKIDKVSDESNREHQLLKWLENKIPVPKVIVSLAEHEQHYLLMERLQGEYAGTDYWLKNPQKLINILAEALKILWQVPIQEVPFDARLTQKLKVAQYNVEHDLCDIEDSEAGAYGENGFASPRELLAWLKAHQPAEDIVFSHGDFCLPNIFIQNEKISGFIDLGRGGISDQYQDIALCYRSLLHNFDGRYNGGIPYPNFDPNALFEALNITPDWTKIRYYILLDELF